MAWFFLGIAAGVLLTVPLAMVVAKRTERRVRRLEQRARANERLAELGTLTGGLAHEIKNPLSTIGLNLQLVQEDLADLVHQSPPGTLPDDRVNRLQRRFDSLTRETHRLRDILEDFLRFAGRIRLDRTATNLNELVDELVDFFEPQAAQAGITIRTQPYGSPMVVSADPSLLKQALLNLLINATQAMRTAREKGKVAHGGANELFVRVDRHGGDALIHVIDTGPGIDEQTLAKIFQPYFSSKPSGTGLGLPTTRRIVEEHGGAVQVHTELGRGTDFTILLPIDPPAADET